MTRSVRRRPVEFMNELEELIDSLHTNKDKVLTSVTPSLVTSLNGFR